MQAIVETIFDAVYLISVITIGVLMIRRKNMKRYMNAALVYAIFAITGGTF